MTTPIIITVPNNYLAVDDMESKVIVDVSPSPPSRKRRLDHLTWEEKMQRKKLKNRVAAQTSRDRKKAKMDEMEGHIQHFIDMNERLLSEVESLKALNERLLSENASLREAARSVAAAPRPAESHPQQKVCLISCHVYDRGAPAGAPRASPTDGDVCNLSELLEHLDSPEYLDTLHQLADQLLQEIDGTAVGENKDDKTTSITKCLEGAEMVGPTTKQLEPSESRVVDTLKKDIDRIMSQHSYAHPYPKTDTVKEENGDKGDLFYASYEANDCVTIEVPSEDQVVEEVAPVKDETDFNTLTNNCLDITLECDMKLLSPMPMSIKSLEDNVFAVSPSHTSFSSDLGYESLSSPLSEPESMDLSDFWCESFPELFPDLA